MTAIAFANTKPIESSDTTLTLHGSGSFEDLSLKPEYAVRKMRFESGSNWFRILPALKDSTRSWMIGLHVISYPGGRFVHPRSLRRGVQTVFDRAYGYLKKNHPELLYSKDNKEGVRLLTDPKMICWVLTEQDGATVARLLVTSGYDGARGGAAGLGYQILRAAFEKDETGKVVSNAIDPDAGYQLCVEKTQSPGARFPSYRLRTGRVQAPVNPLIGGMAPEEIAALCPLENVIRELTEEEQWECLSKTLPPELVAEIRANPIR